MSKQERPCIAIIEYFEDLPDPRQQAKVLYPLSEIILTSLCAIICGADSYVEIEEFGNAKIDFLKQYLVFKNGIPSHDTFGIVYSIIDSKQFSKIFIDWVKSLQKTIPKIVAIDGKTVRRSKNGDVKPIHIVSAWATQQNIVLGQTKTDEKSNEIRAIPELLSLLTLNNAIVTIDAMGCQKNIVDAIVKKKAEYAITIKGNQGNLYRDISEFFKGTEQQIKPFEIQTFQTVEKDHGRIETRIYSITDRIEWLEGRKDWNSLQSIGKVTSVRDCAGVVSQDTRYFITSLPSDVHTFAKAVRGHWGIENGLHWVMDIVFRDDDCRIRKKNGPANFVTLKHITQNMLKTISCKASMRVRRKRAGWDDTFLAAALAANAE